jgi:bacteriocin biosynthesis cyclodehydratase domain-containing protein
MTILATWRPVPDLCSALNDYSFERHQPFVPLVMNSQCLSLGPIVMPGVGGCWACWLRRARQHDTWPQEQAALAHFYKANPELGPNGYLEPFALMGAARLAQTIQALDSSTAIPGQIWTIDLITRRIVVGTLVGIHGCPRCGLGRAEDSRSIAEMRSELSYLWSHEG